MRPEHVQNAIIFISLLIAGGCIAVISAYIAVFRTLDAFFGR